MDKANKMDSKHLPLRFKAQKLRIQLNVTVTLVIELKNLLTSGKCKSGPANARFPLFKELPLPYSAKTNKKNLLNLERRRIIVKHYQFSYM